jgi:hypothetical protein
MLSTQLTILNGCASARTHDSFWLAMVTYSCTRIANGLVVVQGVPDGANLGSAPACSECGGGGIGSEPNWSVFPTTVNTTFPGYPGNWTMKAADNGVAAGGMTSATHYGKESYGVYTYPSAMWSAEIAFPIHSTPGYSSGVGDPHASTAHGGLLDADPTRQVRLPLGLAHLLCAVIRVSVVP